MPSTRSSCNKKRKANDHSVIISFKDTCISLNLPLYRTCHRCVVKKEIAIHLTHKGRQQKNNFQRTHRNNKYEQKWSE